MGLWTLYDVVDTASEIVEITSVAEEAMEQLDIFESEFKKLDDLLGRMEGLKDLSPKEQATEALKIYYDIQDMQALMNPCLRARKCNLVPFKSSDGSNKVEHSYNGGCCPGQTGHHLVLGKMMETSCPDYNHSLAPVVCAEGFSQHLGSHKRVHDELDILTSETIKKGGLDSAGTMSMAQAIENAAESHQKAFRFSNCSKACIKSQLEEYYLNKCKNSRIKPINKNGKNMNGPTAIDE